MSASNCFVDLYGPAWTVAIRPSRAMKTVTGATFCGAFSAAVSFSFGSV